MIYFDFYELQSITEDQIPAIFVLTVGLTLGYNNYRFNNRTDFRYKCPNLLDIPPILFKKKLIYKNNNGEYVINYRTRTPQSYIKNTKILAFNYSINKKVQYLKLMSYRSINNPNNWIPTDYIENLDKICNNELLEIKQDKIHFKYEEVIK